MSTMDVDTVCTEEQLDDYLGGQLTGQTNLVPAAWSDAEPARQFALDETLDSLRRRKPPVRESEITDPTELRRAVQYGAAARLFWLAMTSGNDAELWHVKYRDQRKLYEAEVAGVEITGPSGVQIAGMGAVKLSRG